MARRRNNRRRRGNRFGLLFRVLSVVVICCAIVAACTLFFRVNHVEISGQNRYTPEEIQTAAGVRQGDNLFLMNKYDAARAIVAALPYVEETQIHRKLPDTLVIEIRECGKPMAVVQDGSAWLMNSGGKLVEQRPDTDALEDAGIITGCSLLVPSVGTKIALATEYSVQQESLLGLLGALEKAKMLEDTDGIRLDNLNYIVLEYMGRFDVRMPYRADYAAQLRKLQAVLDTGKIQENMTGTFDMQKDNGEVHFIPDAA